MAGEEEKDEENGKANDASSPRYSRKVADIDTELSKMKASLEIARLDVKNRDHQITLLRAELSEKDVLLRKLGDEVERGKESERKLLDSLGEQTKQLEQTKIHLEESKIEIASLKEKVDGSDSNQTSSEDHAFVQGCDVEALKMELESTKENLARAHEAAEVSSRMVSNLLEEMSLVKNELNLATEAEITSKKAMDDLALALKEVATDCSQVKEKLAIAEVQLEATRLEAQEWKEKLEATEENYKTLVQEARKEAELHKNTSERLRIEAEESLLAWNGKEAVFVNCIKRGEDEKNSLLDENDRLLQALVSAENLSKKAKEENHKLRDILKQAINEANVAKEAAGIARAENSNLKDALLDKEEELTYVLQENERVKLCEAAANENVKKLKRLLSETTLANELRAGEKEKNKVLSRQNSLTKEQSKRLSHQNSMQKDQEVETKNEKREQHNDKKEDKKEDKKDKKEEKKEQQKDKKEDKKEQQKDKKEEKKEDKKEQAQQNEKKMGKTCSFSLRELKMLNKHKDTADEETKATTDNIQQENTDESDDYSPGSDCDLFKGSIFDVAETPDAETTHQRKKSSCTFMEEGEPINPEDLENLECNQLDEGESDKGSRKKKAFIRRFGDLLGRRKSFHKKETSPDQQEKQQQQQQLQPQPQPQSQPPEQ